MFVWVYIFGILQCLVQLKIIVNGNYFQFDNKKPLQFLENDLRKSFYEFKLFIIERTFVGIHHR